MIVRKQSIPKKTITTDKQDSCLNQVHGVCFGMRLRQEPSPGFTAGRQYKTTDSSIAKGSYFQPYWTHTSSRDSPMQPLCSTWDLQVCVSLQI
ncbi:hypothetical protein YC2023_024428 [Brassica napus]